MRQIKRAGVFYCATALAALSGCKSVQKSKTPLATETGKSPGSSELASLTSTTPQGKWGPLMNWPVVAVHMGLTPDGKVLLWDRDDKNDLPNKKYDSLGVYVWNPADGTFVDHPLGTTNLFCSGSTWLGGGLLYAVGGHFKDGVGSPTVNIFNNNTGLWSVGPVMNAGRWYPTAVPLGTGEVLILSGLSKNGIVNTMPQVVDPKTNTIRNLPNSNFGYPLWPRAMQTSSGLVVTVGPDPVARYIDPSPGPKAAKIRVLANAPYKAWRTNGTAAMYETDKILVVGGYSGSGGWASNVAMDFQIGATPNAVSWKLIPGMAYRRTQAVATVLPTGDVFVVGGAQVDGNIKDPKTIVYNPEIWNSTTKTFSTMAPMADARLYHSTAVLLPDGSVLSAGGGQPSLYGPDHKTAQIFYPPYLFAGDRPTIVSAPKTLTFNQSFDVTVTGNISQVSLMRAAMVTHAFDESQRRVKLAFTQVGDKLTIKSPPNGNYAPPGHYMLFVIGANGVPSVASMVNI